MPEMLKSDDFNKIAISVIVALVAAGVVGLWMMSQSVTRMEERLANYIETQRETNTNVVRRLDQVDTRIRSLEDRRTP